MENGSYYFRNRVAFLHEMEATTDTKSSNLRDKNTGATVSKSNRTLSFRILKLKVIFEHCLSLETIWNNVIRNNVIQMTSHIVSQIPTTFRSLSMNYKKRTTITDVFMSGEVVLWHSLSCFCFFFVLFSHVHIFLLNACISLSLFGWITGDV